MTKTLHAFGDSFVLGDQDDFDKYPVQYQYRIDELKNKVSFASILARHYNLNYVNYADRGSGNYPQLDKLFLALTENKIQENDIVIFGLTTFVRDRFVLTEFNKATASNFGPSLVDKQSITQDISKVIDMDFYYINSVLNQLARKFNVKIIKFNLFDDLISSSANYRLSEFVDFIGYDVKGNTLIDILNDTWGKGIDHPYHDQLKVPKGYESLYTIKKHPSELGHKKIAEWWIKNNIL